MVDTQYSKSMANTNGKILLTGASGTIGKEIAKLFSFKNISKIFFIGKKKENTQKVSRVNKKSKVLFNKKLKQFKSKRTGRICSMPGYNLLSDNEKKVLKSLI